MQASGVQLAGITKDKTQVTTTICVNELGEVLPPQMIFGGSTDRCHPKDAAPLGGFYCHSTTHWQTAETMINWIDSVLIPFKTATITMQGLPENQKSVLICDLHFSHKDIAVLQHLQDNNIEPVFLPTGFSDELLVIELACKKPFQQAAKSRFRLFVHDLLTTHIELGKPLSEFTLNFNVGFLKPFVPKCVEDGMEALQTPDMRAAIAACFAKKGCMEICRDETRITAARASWVPHHVPAEVEGDPVAAVEEEDDEDDM